MKNSKIKNKGFTLVETVVVMAIVSIISSTIFLEIKSYKSFRNEIDVDYFNDEVISFINQARHYCILNDYAGNIMTDEQNNTFKFNVNSILRDRLEVPRGFKISNVNAPNDNSMIIIDENGVLDTSCTFTYIDRNGKSNYITIGVGTTNAEIKY